MTDERAIVFTEREHRAPIQVDLWCPVCGDIWGDAGAHSWTRYHEVNRMIAHGPEGSWAITCGDCTLADLHRRLK